MHRDFPLPNRDWTPANGFWDAAARGELAIPRCASCERLVWYPKESCPSCGGTSMPYAATSGAGRLYSWTEVHHVFLPAYAELVPYTVGLVALDDDPRVRVAAWIDAHPATLHTGAPMRARFGPRRFAGVDRGITAPYFVPDR